MRHGRWVLAIGAWTATTAALSLYGIDRMQSLRHDLLAATRRPPATVAPTGSLGVHTEGGDFVTFCVDGLVRVQQVTPAPGFRVEHADRAPGPESHVTFKTDGREVRAVVRCAAEGPRADVTVG
jgi:hypothetical protein